MPKVTKEVTETFRAANPGTDAHVVSNPNMPDDEFIVRTPSRSEWDLFRSMSAGGGHAERIQAEELLFRSCVLWPSEAERNAVVDKYPACISVVTGEITELAGASQKATHRKL